MFNFLTKKLIESKMKDVPQEQRDMVFAMIEKNPQFFQKVAEEVKAEMAKGKDQMAATMEVMKRHEKELRSMM